MPGISLLIKPVFSACNLHCGYCFYRDIAENREQPCRGSMGLDMLEKTVAQAMEYSEGTCSLLFQG